MTTNQKNVIDAAAHKMADHVHENTVRLCSFFNVEEIHGNAEEGVWL